MKNLILFVMIVNLVFYSCENASNNEKEISVYESEKPEKTKKSSETKLINNQYQKENAQLDTANNFTPIKSKSLKIKSKNTDSISPKTIIDLSSNDKKYVIPTKWKNTYSSDIKWMELYDSSRNFFLNGWKNEFIEHPTTQLTKEELLNAYRKRMENVFYETPSFIEFCVQELEESPEFLAFCEQWNDNIK